MKASVCIGSDKWSIPYSDKDKVGDILDLAVARYAKHTIKVAGRSEGACCHFKTIDGAILDNDDLMVDVIDDNDVIIVVFGSVEDCENPNETESSASSGFSAGGTPRFQKVLPRLSHLQTPPLPPNLQLQQKFSTGPRQKSSSTKTPDRFRSQDEILTSFSRLGARKSLGNSLSQDHWFEARHKLQNKQELEILEDVNNNNNKSSSQNSLKNDNRAESNVLPVNNNQAESSNMTSRSSSSVSLNQLTGASLPPSPQVSNIVGLRPKSAVIGYLTEFRGHEVTTRKLLTEEKNPGDLSKQVPGDDGGVNLEAPIQNSSASSSSSSLKKKKNQSNAVLAPSNTRVIGKMMKIVLSKGVSGLGFTITSRDNMAELNSPIYIKNILPGGAAQLDGRLMILDRLLAVNGVDVSEAKQTEATQLLRQIPVGSQVELLISRQVDEDTNDAMESDRNEVQEVESENPKPDKSFSSVDEGHPDHFHLQSGVSEIGERPKCGAYDLNSSRQPSMTKEMEKFLSSSFSPPYNSQETIPLRQLLPYGHCNLKPLVKDQKFVGMLIQASPSHPEFQLLEIDGKPLTSEMSKDACIKLVKVAIDRAWSKGGEKVMVKISRSSEFFKYQVIINGSKLNNVHNPPTAQMLNQPSAESIWGMPPMPYSSRVHKIHEKDKEVSLSSSKSAPTTPMTAKFDRLLPGTEEVAVTEENAERDDECQQGGLTFDRKGFGRQSMSEKRKGHADPRNLDFYRQMSSHKIKMLGDKTQDNDGGTSYATWDSRKAARMRKAANAMSTSKSEILPSANSEKQYKSMEELSGNQEQPALAPPKAADAIDPRGSSMNDLDIRMEGQERTAAKTIDNHDNGGRGVDDDQQGRADGRNVKKISRLRRDKKAITQEHKKLISYMKKTVENLRLSPQSDTPFGAAVTPPLKNYSNSQISSKYPYRAPLMSEGAVIDGYPVSATSPGSSKTPSPDKELNKSNPTSSLKFTFRSLPKKFSRSAWPFHVSKVKGCDGGQEVSPEGIPTGRLQPEGKEEVNHSHLSQMDSRFLSSNSPPSSSTSSSMHLHKTLAHVPVLRVEETSNIYKDIAQQRQQQEESSWQQTQQQDSPPPQWFGISTRGPTRDWSHRPMQIHLRQQSQDLDRPSLDRYGGIHYTSQHHNVFLPLSQHQCPQLVQHAQQQVYSSPQHQRQKFIDTDSNPHGYDCTTIIHRPQRSYDGFAQTPPAGRATTSVSLKMKPPDVRGTCGVLGHDSVNLSGPGIHSYSPEMQYRTYLSHNRGPKYVTTLRVNCDDDGGDSLSPNAIDYDLPLVHPPKPPQNLHQDVPWTRSARV